MSNQDIKTVKKNLLKGSNLVRRALEDYARDNTTYKEGVTFNQSRMVQGLALAKKGIVDNNLYNKRKQVIKVQAGFSFASDHSASLNWGNSKYWKQICLLLAGMHDLSDKLGVLSTSALIRQRYAEDCRNRNCSTNQVPHMIRLLDHKQKWKDSYFEQIKEKRPNSGTSLICYAESALQMVRELPNCTHRVAFFLTDGECHEKMYLESLRQSAAAEGILLVGIGLGLNGTGLPNGIDGYTAEEISLKMCKILADLLKGN